MQLSYSARDVQQDIASGCHIKSVKALSELVLVHKQEVHKQQEEYDLRFHLYQEKEIG